MIMRRRKSARGRKTRAIGPVRNRKLDAVEKLPELFKSALSPGRPLVVPRLSPDMFPRQQKVRATEVRTRPCFSCE